jgi:sugar/nucleoside kinase (ribokinase family)
MAATIHLLTAKKTGTTNHRNPEKKCFSVTWDSKPLCGQIARVFFVSNWKTDIVAIGACYVDTNVDDFPFDKNDIVGEEIIGKRYEIAPGGSAVNFCRLGIALGLRTAFIGTTGNDANADILEQLLTQEGVQSALIRKPDLQTNISFNITNAHGDHLMFVAGTANAALDPAAVIVKLKELLSEAGVLYLGGCLKLNAFAHAFGEIVSLAKQTSTQLVVDHGRVPDAVSKEMLRAVKDLVVNSTYYFPSREEFCTLWKVSTTEEGLDKLQKTAPNLVVVVKDGANGAFYRANGSTRHFPVKKVDKIVNATGAGDSFNAGVITALRKEHSLPDAIAYGCKVAAAKIKTEDLPTL